MQMPTRARRPLRRDWQLYSLAVLPLVFFLLFRYLPMIGNVIAFRRFEPGGSILGESWVGLRYVRMFLGDPTFWQVFRNTLWLGGLTLVFCFPIPIVLALLLNEVRRRSLKRFVQSVSYLPHFLSIVIVAGITLQMLATDGPVNHALGWFGHDPSGSARSTSARRSGRPPAGARSSTSPRSPPSTTTSTRPPASTARAAGGRSGTSPCPASAPP
jgi:putative aldouronate transport system permease protein